MFQILKTKFLDSPILYLNYLRLFKRINPTILPNLDSKFIITGFPRSGNTYISDIIKFNFPDIEFSHHIHTLAPIKMGLKKEIPVIILIRNPIDSISSLYLKLYINKNHNERKKNKILKILIERYINYHEYIIQKKLKNVYEFDDIIKYSEDFILNICEKLNINYDLNKIRAVLNTERDILIKENPKRISHKADVLYKNGKIIRLRKKDIDNPFTNYLPNSIRTKNKGDLKVLIKKIESSKRALELYENLKEANDCNWINK